MLPASRIVRVVLFRQTKSLFWPREIRESEASLEMAQVVIAWIKFEYLHQSGIVHLLEGLELWILLISMESVGFFRNDCYPTLLT